MTYVPDEPVFRSVEDVMQSHGQLEHAKTGAKMASGLAHRPQQKRAQFPGQLRKLLRRQLSQLGRGIDPVQQRGVGPL